MPLHNSMWRHYPAVKFAVEARDKSDRAPKQRLVISTGGDRFVYKRRDGELLSSLLSPLRHITTLRIVFRIGCTVPPAEEYGMRSAAFATLHHFKRLRSLEVRCVQRTTTESLAAALNSLPSLTSLDVDSYDITDSDELTATLHQLCSAQLNHVTISRRWLFHLFRHRAGAVMRRLLSLTVTPAVELDDERAYSATSPRVPLFDMFPSLLHLSIGSSGLLPRLAPFRWPDAHERLSSSTVPQRAPLFSSFTVHGSVVLDTDLSHISTRTLCVYYSSFDSVAADRGVCDMLMWAPRMQQLSIDDISLSRHNHPFHVFPTGTVASSRFSELVYLDFVACIPLADLTYLLDCTAPPVFAAQLTHLALKVYSRTRAAAAILLPSLPSMYPSLTHVYIGFDYESSDDRLVECPAWDTALQAVRAAVGSAWCASMEDVVAWREDVAWRRGAGVPEQQWFAEM